MKKNVIVFGIIAGLIVTSMMIWSTSQCYTNADWQPSAFLGYTTMLVAFSFIFVAVRNYRDKYNEGTVTFGRAFLIGLYITLIASVMYVVVWVIDYYVFVPDFMEKYTERMMQDAISNGEDTAALQAEMEMYKKLYTNPLYVVLLTFGEILPVGLVVSLIVAVILKRKNANVPATAN
jgi:hypothetical protein